MRTIDIFVSSPADVQKERAVAEQLIRSVAAEFNVPVNVSFSNPIRGANEEYKIKVERRDCGDGSTLVLCPRFWQYPESEEGDFLEQIPNTGQFDLVICILWSRLGSTPAQKCVMPDSSRPASATDYEVAWVLDQWKWTPGSPELHVYRNRATPDAPLEPKEKRESLCRQWDAVEKFCAAWEKNGGQEFRECCHEYRELEEFENLFREHLSNFLARQLDRQIGAAKALREVRYLESNPFRGLNFFDFEHATLFHGRTKAIWEVLDVLKSQAMAKKPFVLVLGPAGSGKSSLVRAGILPLLTQGGTPVGNGPWRRAVTRPGAGGLGRDPFDTLAAALLSKCALPELKDKASADECRDLASQLREAPNCVAARITEVLDQLARQEADRSVNRLVPEFKHKAAITPKMRLALVVDQLEELFTGVSRVARRKYVAALCALANCEGVFIIATLRSDFYPLYEQFPELVALTALNGRYELQPPTPRGIGNIIRFPAGAAGLRFERDANTGRSLDEALLEEAIACPKPLPLLEHLLSRLYTRQLDQKDGLLRWSAYRGLGGLQDALARHAETVFSTLNRDEQQALKFVIRHLIAFGRGEEGPFIRRTVPYRDLIWSPKYWDPTKCFGGLNQRQRAGAKGLVDRLIKEGLLSAEDGPKQELLISVPQDTLLRRWPGVWQWLSGDRNFFRMRDRLDASLKLWLSRGCRSNDLLERGIGLAEAEALLRDFGSSLTQRQTEYIRKSLARQKRRRWMRDNIGLAAIASLAAFAAVAAVVERFSTESRRRQGDQDVQQGQQNTDFVTNRRTVLETELIKAQEEKAQLAQQNSDLTSQSSALKAELKKIDEKAQLAQQNIDLTTDQRSALEIELKKAREEKAQLAQQNSDLTSQSSVLKAELEKIEEKAQLAQQNIDLTTSQRSALETELKKAREEKAQLAQQNSDLTSQSSVLKAELKKIEEKAQLEQQNIDLTTSQRSALETTLEKALEEKAQLVQQNSDLTSQSSALKAELKKIEEKALLAQQSIDLATSQRSALETELKKAREEKAQLAQQNTDLAGQLSALEAEFKKVREEKAQLLQQNANLSSRSSDLDTQLKKTQDERVQLVQQNANLINQSKALQTQLEGAEEKTQLTQQKIDLATSQRNALEAQLGQEQERAQKAQAKADIATSELRAVRLGQSSADRSKNPITALTIQPTLKVLYSESRIAASLTFPWFMAVVTPEEAAYGLSWARNSRLNEPQGVSPAPSPSIEEPQTSIPPESQLDRNAEASGEEEFLKEFVLGYLRTVASNDTSVQRRYFGERVNFYGRGVLNPSNLEASTQRYHDEWPIRNWAPRGEAKVVRSSDPNLFVVYQPFNWSVSDGSHNAHGDATLYLRIRKNSQGELRIVYVRQLDR